MHKSRLEAFSDGVIAIIITVMVLELKVPHSGDWSSLAPLGPEFISYVLSFIYIGIYWSNHHHLFQAVENVRGPSLWANLHLLFWLSLVPFTTTWMGENNFSQWPVLLYGFNLIFSSIAYFILVRTLLRDHDRTSRLAQALGKDTKGKVSTAIYAVGIALTFVAPWLSYGLYILVALMWLVPDKRVEKVLMRQKV